MWFVVFVNVELYGRCSWVSAGSGRWSKLLKIFIICICLQNFVYLQFYVSTLKWLAVNKNHSTRKCCFKMVFQRLIWRILKSKNKILVFLSSLLLLVESFDKTVDVNGLKLYGENSDQVHFKFQLSKRDNPKAGFKSNFSTIEFLPADVFEVMSTDFWI